MSGTSLRNGEINTVSGTNISPKPTSVLAQDSQIFPSIGDIVGLNLLGQPMIVLNSAEHAVALLDKRGTLYSDRPMLMMGGELVGWKYTLALTPYGERFREYRRYIAKSIGGRTQMEDHLELIERQTMKFLVRVLNDPDNIATQIRKYVSS
jgi:hypothetical protein